jgi:hypothetical protein
MTSLTIGGTFRTGEPFLHGLLEDINSGKLQVPDFQRPWVWDDHHIRDLLASVTQSQPIGAVMLLETGGESSKFLPRLIEGVALDAPRKPERLVLDGQQRLTSLYRALRSRRPVDTYSDKGEAITRVYYLDIGQCLDAAVDRYDAILSLPPDRMRTSDFGRKIDLDVSTKELEWQQALLPAELIFDGPAWQMWVMGFQNFHGFSPDKMVLIGNFMQSIWLPLQQYKIPVIELFKETPKEAICTVFEKVNTGGVSLTVFELLTATYAADNFRLRQDWEERRSRMRSAIQSSRILQEVSETDFLTAITLLVSVRRSKSNGSAVSCKRRDVLRLELCEYLSAAKDIEEGFIAAAKFMTLQKIFDSRSLPYATQMIPLSVICSLLGSIATDASVREKLAQWYWCGIFGELYGGANETRYAQDVADVPTWISGGTIPRTIEDSNFAPVRLLTLHTRQSAAYKGIMGLLMQEGSDDWINGQPIDLTTYFNETIDIHHVFPRAYCQRQCYDERRWNSVVNKTPLSTRTNQILGGDAPSLYLKRVGQRASAGSISKALVSHAVNEELLRSDQFDEFIRDRAERLLNLIEKATAKAVAGRDSAETNSAFGGPLIETEGISR